MTDASDIFDITDIEPPPPTFKCSNLGRLRYESSYSIYPLSELPALVDVIRKKKDPLVTIRYLVDSNYNIWFAEEGGACATIPAHYQMTGDDKSGARCIAAGNITFSPDYKTIVEINNKSGDFRPSFDSLKWALAVLILNIEKIKKHITLAPVLSIERLAEGALPRCSYELDTEALGKWVADVFTKKIALLQKQPTEIKKTCYAPPPREVSPVRGAFRGARLLFHTEPATDESLAGKKHRRSWETLFSAADDAAASVSSDTDERNVDDGSIVESDGSSRRVKARIGF